jgi:hypothetical protein
MLTVPAIAVIIIDRAIPDVPTHKAARRSVIAGQALQADRQAGCLFDHPLATEPFDPDVLAPVLDEREAVQVSLAVMDGAFYVPVGAQAMVFAWRCNGTISYFWLTFGK